MTPAERERELIAEAAACGPMLAANAERHDRDGTWVSDSFERLRELSLGDARAFGLAGRAVAGPSLIA